MDINITTLKPEMLEIGSYILKWDFRRREYDKLPLDPALKFGAIADEHILCANCRETILVEEAYSSSQWQNPYGLSYSVCKTCKQIELENSC